MQNVFEIVSADSVQVYRFLDIGSGKPSQYERKIVDHHLIDIADPDFNFTAGEFVRKAEEACRHIYAKGKIPLFVGGTGLYLDAFFKGISEIPAVDIKIREKLIDELNEWGLKSLYDELFISDNKFAEKIHSNDKQRILRGLEVFRQTGRPLSSFYDNKDNQFKIDALFIGIKQDRLKLRENIDKRVDLMINSGLIDEVSGLRDKGYHTGLKSMKSIGYREINRYIDGELTIDDAVSEIKLETKRYAKRQMTWFRKNSSINWFDVSDYNSIKVSILNFVSGAEEVL